MSSAFVVHKQTTTKKTINNNKKMKTKPSTCHSLEGQRFHMSQNQKCAPARRNKVRRSLLQKKVSKYTKQHTKTVRPHGRIPVRQRQMLWGRGIQLLTQYRHNIITRDTTTLLTVPGFGEEGRITWPHAGTHLQNEAGAFHAPSVEPDPDPLH